jgi:hypothetical protein
MPVRIFLVWIVLASAAACAGGQSLTAPGPDGRDMAAAMDDMPAMDHWMTMVHGFAFLNYDDQGGPSGGHAFESQNHFMGMATHSLLGGGLTLYATLSLEPATIPSPGSHELFQVGETYRGVLLVDYQHPHDFATQLAASWSRTLSPDLSVSLYAALVGEPALGPPAFVHRLSASENPTAPLAHHSQDSTHISYDVITLGLKTALLTLEGSVFHGAEPDENRWNIQTGALDSYSGRLTSQPLPGFTVQVSAGHLTHPESDEPGNQNRFTGMLAYQTALPHGFLAVSLITGQTQEDEVKAWGTTLEATWKFADANFVYTRLEAVDRDLYELTYKHRRPPSVPLDRTRVYAATLGYVRDLPSVLSGVSTGVGGDATLYRFNPLLDGVYSAHPVSFHGFVRVRFSFQSGMGGMGGMDVASAR